MSESLPLKSQLPFKPMRYITNYGSGRVLSYTGELPTEGGSGGPSYDADAQSWFTRVGGSFDFSVIDPTYTESYTKTAWSDFVAGLKTDLLWDTIYEAYAQIACPYAGLPQKLKGTGTLTLHNFTSGDYVAAGAGAGLIGDGSTKYISGGYAPSTTTGSLSAYVTGYTAGTAAHIGCDDSANRVMLLQVSPAMRGYWGTSVTNRTEANVAGTGFFCISSRASNDHELYKNGVSASANATPYSPVAPNTPLYLFARNNNGSATNFSPNRLIFAHVGQPLTTAQQLLMQTRVEALADAFGAGVVA